MHRGNVAGDGTKANFHLFKLGWRERVRKSARESFDALKMIITISKSASEENVLPWLCPPIPSSSAPYHLIQRHNGCRCGCGGPGARGGRGRGKGRWGVSKL